MTRDRPFQPEWVSAPGETIADIIGRRDLSLADFAEQIGHSIESTDNLLCGYTAITREVAGRLEDVLGISAQFWLARESQYRGDLTRRNLLAKHTSSADWIREIPVRDMIKFGWLEPVRRPDERVSACLRFFAVPDVEAWQKAYHGMLDVVAFRTSEAFRSNPGAVAAWIRQGEIAASKIDCGTWDSPRFRDALSAIRKLTRRNNPSLFLPELERRCAECGVAVTIVRAPSGCRASGATRFLTSDKALLLLSFRHRSDDHFWFSFFHEAGHLLLHSKNALFLEGSEMLSTDEEYEADQFATRTLIPKKFQDEMLILDKNFREVIKFASRVGVSPGIVVGQLQHAGSIRRNQLNFLKRRFAWQNGQPSVSRESV